MHRLNPRIYGFGTAAIDFRITTADFGESYRDKLLARERKVLGGGSVANTLVQIARLGGAAAWLGKLGTDWIGDRIVEDLRADRVDCSHVIRDKSECSPFNVAVYAEGRRVGGFLLPNSLQSISEDESSRMGALAKQNDWVIVEIGEVPLDRVLSYCRAVRSSGGMIAINIDLDPEKQCLGPTECLRNILSLSDVIVPNLKAMATLYPKHGPRELSQKVAADFAVATVVTAGEQGAYWCHPDQSPMHYPAETVAVVDTVGAGDAFLGGLVFPLAQGESLADAVSLGTRCGAAACTAFGARSGMLIAAEL